MFTEKDFKVTLRNPEEVKTFIKRHGEFACCCYNTDEKYAEKVGEHCLHSGHFSGSRHLYFDFKIECVPRFLIDQLVRHEQGVVKNVQSLRYCTKDKVNLYTPPEVMKDPILKHEFELYEANVKYDLENLKTLMPEGLKQERVNEITRSILPIGIASACSFACNIEGLIHLANMRLCVRAEYPIRKLTQMMIDEVIKIEPRYKEFLVPNCVRYDMCPEGNAGCGRYKNNH